MRIPRRRLPSVRHNRDRERGLGPRRRDDFEDRDPEFEGAGQSSRRSCPPGQMDTTSAGLALPAAVYLMAGIILEYPPYQPLIMASASIDAWRMIELVSLEKLTFRANLSWMNGGGSGGQAEISVCRSTRICLYARTVSIQVANTTDAALSVAGSTNNNVRVQISNGAMPTENQLEVTGATDTGLAPGFEQDVPIAQFAQRVRLEVADPAVAAISMIRLYDGRNALISTTVCNGQPDIGIPLGQAARLTVQAASKWRLVFTLKL